MKILTLLYTSFLPGSEAEYYISKYSLEPKGRKFHQSKESFLPQYECDYFLKGFHGQEAVNRKMILIQDLGIYEYFKRQHALLASIKSGLKKAKEKEEIALEDKLNLIKLKHFTAGLIFLFAAYCTGMVCIIFEILFFSCIQK